MKLLRIGLFVLTLAVFPTMLAAQTSVLIADADNNDNADLTSALLTEFDTVDDFNLGAGTPVLADLTPYDVVVAYTDFSPDDPVAAGDVLADYVDAGGCVVMSTYAFSSPWAISGRMQTPGYSPLLNVGVNGNVSGNINAIVANDPIFDGINLGAVTYFRNSNFSHPDLDAGATLIADDGAGINMIARNGTGNVVGLNLFPGNIGGNNGELYSLFANAAANCAGLVHTGIARFKVTKTFSDDLPDTEVDVELTCSTGLPLSQPASITGGDPVGVTFVITNLPEEGGANCEVTESGSPAGYTPVFNGGAGCSWTGVTGGLRTCEIHNLADPATFTVYKDWVVLNDGGDAVVGEAIVTATCDAEIVGGIFDIGTGYWSKTDALGDGEKLVATVDTTEGSVSCWASESLLESGVESEDNCGARSIAAGGSSSCTFTNTVFFEGIPTLSQYGLAIMALLMLGVGFIGFRRFV